MPTPTTTHIDDHEDRAIARLPGYQQSATNWIRLLRATLSEAQAFEDALDQLQNERHLSVAIGQQLDDIGTILDEAREGKSDGEYRIVLQGRASELAGSGEGDRVIDAYLFLTGAEIILLTEHQPATMELFALIVSDTFTAAEDAAILESVKRIRAAGVQVILVVVEDSSTDPDLNAFIWGDSADADANGDLPVDADHGYGDSADADGDGDITAGAGKGGVFGRLL